VSKVKEKFGFDGASSSILSSAVGHFFLLLDSLIVSCSSFLDFWLEEVASNGGSWLESWLLDVFSMLFFSAITLGHEERRHNKRETFLSDSFFNMVCHEFTKGLYLLV
jgi:hypothetical protein